MSETRSVERAGEAGEGERRPERAACTHERRHGSCSRRHDDAVDEARRTDDAQRLALDSSPRRIRHPLDLARTTRSPDLRRVVLRIRSRLLAPLTWGEPAPNLRGAGTGRRLWPKGPILPSLGVNFDP